MATTKEAWNYWWQANWQLVVSYGGIALFGFCMFANLWAGFFFVPWMLFCLSSGICKQFVLPFQMQLLYGLIVALALSAYFASTMGTHSETNDDGSARTVVDFKPTFEQRSAAAVESFLMFGLPICFGVAVSHLLLPADQREK